ncbi:MAG: 3-methyladenine DNA glycosylase [Methanosphaera sp.]|nr:3-methyladenine DNA glycosylase [Methanosphaera sp.]
MNSGQFIIDNNEYIGDFDLDITINSGQTSQPPWTLEDNKYYEILEVYDSNVLVGVSQDGLNKDLIVDYYSEDDVDIEDIRKIIFYLFDLDYNIGEVYDFLNDNRELSDVYEFNKGLRLYKAQYPYECIISSICSANNSIKRWTKSINDIKKEYGTKLIFNNKEYYVFPEESVFVNIPDTDDGLKKFGVGYRSKYMINSTKMILDNPDFHDIINKSSYNEAFEKILELEGVGPKVADCILLYGYNKHEAYPVDVWINRITSHIYFPDQKPSNQKIMSFAQEKFGEYAGYVQLYLFNYARLSGLTEKLKAKKS